MKTIRITQAQLAQSILVIISGYFVVFSLELIYGIIGEILLHGLKMLGFDLLSIAKYLVVFDGLITSLLIVAILTLILKKLNNSSFDSDILTLTIPIKYFWTIGIVALVSFVLKIIFGWTRNYAVMDAMKDLPESEISKCTNDARYYEAWIVLLNQIKTVLLYILYFGLIFKIKKVTKPN
jgi:hypothetical protein